TKSPRTMIKNIRHDPAIKVESLPRPPDVTLITDWPIIAQPAMPPKKPVIVLAIPCPLASLFFVLSVPVMSSTILDVSKDSNSPTIARAIENGKIIANVSNVNGTFGIKNDGNELVIEPKSPDTCKSTLQSMAIPVNSPIAIKGVETDLMKRRTIYTIKSVIATNTYVILFIPMK